MTQAVFLFRAETWVLTSRMDRDLSSFEHKFARQLTGRHPRIRGGGNWGYPFLEEAMVEAGFEGIGTYVTRRQNTAAQYIATRPILDLCERSARRPGAWVSRRWWEQDGLDLEGAKKRAAAELDGEESISKEGVMPLETTTGRE